MWRLRPCLGSRLCRELWPVSGISGEKDQVGMEMTCWQSHCVPANCSSCCIVPMPVPFVNGDSWGQKGGYLIWVLKNKIEPSWWPPGQEFLLLHEARELRNRSWIWFLSNVPFKQGKGMDPWSITHLRLLLSAINKRIRNSCFSSSRNWWIMWQWRLHKSEFRMLG